MLLLLFFFKWIQIVGGFFICVCCVIPRQIYKQILWHLHAKTNWAKNKNKTKQQTNKLCFNDLAKHYGEREKKHAFHFLFIFSNLCLVGRKVLLKVIVEEEIGVSYGVFDFETVGKSHSVQEQIFIEFYEIFITKLLFPKF